MQVIPITETNINLYHTLAQYYEAEFSPLTGKKPDASGMFELDTHLGEEIMGFLLQVDHVPAGTAAIAFKGDKSYEVCEFYVLPCFRKNSIGMKFAHKIWELYPGDWEIKQLQGAEYATRFWRKTIERFHQTTYREDDYQDPYWGTVIRQQFTVDAPS